MNRHTQHAALLFGMLGTTISACHKFDCERVVPRLLRDCRTLFGMPLACWTVHPTEKEDFEALAIRYCDTISPSGDEACYLTSPCDQLETCVSSNQSSTQTSSVGGANADYWDCRGSCALARQSCDRGCWDRPSLSACDDCGISCEAGQVACEVRCEALAQPSL